MAAEAEESNEEKITRLEREIKELFNQINWEERKGHVPASSEPYEQKIMRLQMEMKEHLDVLSPEDRDQFSRDATSFERNLTLDSE